MIDHYRAGLYPRQHATFAQRNAPDIVVIADTHEDDVRVPRRLRGCWSRTSIVLRNPGVRTCSSAVVDPNIVPRSGQMARHRVTHDAQAHECQLLLIVHSHLPTNPIFTLPQNRDTHRHRTPLQFGRSQYRSWRGGDIARKAPTMSYVVASPTHAVCARDGDARSARQPRVPVGRGRIPKNPPRYYGTRFRCNLCLRALRALYIYMYVLAASHVLFPRASLLFLLLVVGSDAAKHHTQPMRACSLCKAPVPASVSRTSKPTSTGPWPRF